MVEIKKQTYSEQVVNYIKQCILEGEYLPGSQVKEVLLAQKLSISRAPIREALQILAQEGLIVSEPQKGKYIKALTSKQIKDSYFTGGVLEGAAVATVLDLYTDEDMACLEEIVREMKEIADQGGSIEKISELDTRFHKILFSKVDNDHLVNLCHRSCQGISKFLLFRHWLKLHSAHEVYERHKVILDSLKKKDPMQLEMAIRTHYTEAGERMSMYGVDVYSDPEK